VIANGVEWAVTDRPRRELPVLLRYESGEFFEGHGYQGPLADATDAAEGARA
jgi:hypothetical protein